MRKWIRFQLTFNKALSAAFALLLSVLAHAEEILSPANVTSSIPNYTANGGLPKWQACRAKVNAGTANCKILVIGESTPAGGTAFFNSANDQRAGSWPTQLAIVLRQMYNLNARSNSIAGDSNIGATIYPADDTRITLNNWSIFVGGSCYSLASVGACPWYTTTKDANFVFQPSDTGTFPSNATVQTDTLEIWSIIIGGYSGTTTVNIDGGSTLATITSGSTSHFLHTTVTGALGNNRWNVVCSAPGTGGCFFQVLLARNSAVSEVSVINAGWAGATVVNWNVNTGGPQDPLLAIEAIAPDLCLIQDSGNDTVARTPVDRFVANTENIIDACQQSGDAMIITSQPQSPALTPYDVQQTYITAGYTSANAKNIPIFDWFKSMCGTISGAGGSATASKDCWEAGMGGAWNGAWNGAPADAAHQSVAAYAIEATFIAQILMQ